MSPASFSVDKTLLRNEGGRKRSSLITPSLIADHNHYYYARSPCNWRYVSPLQLLVAGEQEITSQPLQFDFMG